MRTNLATWIAILASTALGTADVAEEETWYSAEGKVVKTVKRDLTDSHGGRSADWEPAWVIRERLRDSKRGSGHYYRPRFSGSRGYHAGYGYYPYCYAGYYYYPRSSCRFGRSGVRGYVRTGSGGTRWGVGYRGSGFSLMIRR